MSEVDGVFSNINRSDPPLLDLVDDQWATDTLSDDDIDIPADVLAAVNDDDTNDQALLGDVTDPSRLGGGTGSVGLAAAAAGGAITAGLKAGIADANAHGGSSGGATAAAAAGGSGAGVRPAWLDLALAELLDTAK